MTTRVPASRSRALALWAAAALVACEGGTTSQGPGVLLPPVPCTPATATPTTRILIVAQFLPFCATVPAGVEVTFANADVEAHSATADEGQPEAFESGTLQPGQQFSYAFSRAETVRVHCRLHPEVSATVIVQ